MSVVATFWCPGSNTKYVQAWRSAQGRPDLSYPGVTWLIASCILSAVLCIAYILYPCKPNKSVLNLSLSLSQTDRGATGSNNIIQITPSTQPDNDKYAISMLLW